MYESKNIYEHLNIYFDVYIPDSIQIPLLKTNAF
jgi:hypothetical protein